MIKQLLLAVAAVALIIVGVFAAIDSMAPTQQEQAAASSEVPDARFKEK